VKKTSKPKLVKRNYAAEGGTLPLMCDLHGRVLLKCPDCDKEYKGPNLENLLKQERKAVVEEAERYIDTHTAFQESFGGSP